MLDNSEDDDSSGITRRAFLKRSLGAAGAGGLAAICAKSGMLFSVITALTACTGVFKVERLNNASRFEDYRSNEDIRSMRGCFLNGADVRGPTENVLETITQETAEYRLDKLGKFLVREKVDFFFGSEFDYDDTFKTGNLNQPKVLAKAMGSPYNYVVFDQYMKSWLWTTGNCVISRFPLKVVKRHIFGRGKVFGRVKHMYKDFIHVKAKVGKRKLDIIVNHLYDKCANVRMQEIQEEMAYLLKLYGENRNRRIVAPGDYNCTHNSCEMRHFLSQGILKPPQKNFGLKTYKSPHPTRDIDHVFASNNISIKNFRTFYFPWSDHYGLLFDLVLK